MNIVVVGGGLAAANAVDELRTQGYDEDLLLVGAEPHLPYERPPLSKGVLLGTAEPDSVFVHDQQWYDEQRVEVRTGARVSGIDLDRRHVLLGDEEIAYDRLLIATGARPRRLPEAMTKDADVTYLRTLDDARELQSRLIGHVVIVGAGWIGLEVAAAARERGATVTVVEPQPLPLLAVVGSEVAPVFADLHREHGVDLRLGTQVVSVEGRLVELSDGSRIEGDLVVVGIGAVPRDELATQAGLATDNGIHVDAALRTSDPFVFAAGDVARQDHPLLGPLRVEHWDNAIEQGKHAAHAMLGDDRPYKRMPYFFSDQYDLGLEYVGHVGPKGYDEVDVRGDVGKRQLVVTWRRDDRTVAGMHLNEWDAIGELRAAVEEGVRAGVR